MQASKIARHAKINKRDGLVNVIKYPHPVLKHKSKPLKRIDKELVSVIHQMFELMYQSDGIGLAANQVNLPYRFFILNVTGDANEKSEEMVFINPVISKKKGRAEATEGCLSFPDIQASVIRPAEVVIEAYGLDGKKIEMELKGLLGRAVQHESDHLNGVCFVDRLSPTEVANVREDLRGLELEFDSQQRQGLIPPAQEIVSHLAELEKMRT
jgi:peptide deformylase